VEELWSRASLRTMVWLALGCSCWTVVYLLVVPRLLEPYRIETWAWTAFLLVHLFTFASMGVLAVRRGSLAQRVVAFLGVIALLVYAFFFVWLNVWGA
jgi:hypothetical protein